jgi:hypothetical protein
MNERDRADQFSTEVDALLRSAGRAQDEAGPDSDADLDVARLLAQEDFSDGSQVRHTLRARLLERLDRGATPRERLKATAIGRLRAPRPALMAVIGAMAAVLLVGLLWPGALTAAAQGLERGIQRLFLGAHTSVEQVTPGTTIQEAEAAQTEQLQLPEDALWAAVSDELGLDDEDGGLWVIRSSIAIREGRPASGLDVTPQLYDSFDEAQTVLDLRLLRPTYLPTGLALREVRVTAFGGAVARYGGTSGRMVFSQTPVGEGETGLGADSIATITNRPVREVQVRGVPGAWIEGLGLVWESDRVTYTLDTDGLTLAEALRVAESLR